MSAPSDDILTVILLVVALMLLVFFIPEFFSPIASQIVGEYPGVADRLYAQT